MVIFDAESGASRTLALKGLNPRWSADDRYIAVANGSPTGGVRVADAATGREVLRTTGLPRCVGDYWHGSAIAFLWPDELVTVPEGQITPGNLFPASDFSYDQAAPLGMTRVLREGKVLAEFTVEAPWSSTYDGDGVYDRTSDGRLLMLVGIGGKGLCDGGTPEPAVSLPPFSD